MTPRFGYTTSQARALQHAIDRDMAAIEDRAYRMRQRVGDIGVGTASVELQLEELREVAAELKAIVDRRTNVV